MRFLYVDRILQCELGKSILGYKNVTRNEALFYWLPNGQRVLSPAVVSESMAQLGAWLSIVSSDFMKRPVLLADEMTTYFRPVHSGECLRLEVEVLGTDGDVIVTKGSAKVGDELVAESKCTRGYLLDIDEFHDREQCQRDFRRLFTQGSSSQQSSFPVIPEFVPIPPLAGSYSFESLRYLDGIISHKAFDEVQSVKQIASSESYFAEHFPRRPVVPGVMLLSFVGETCQYLLKENIRGPLRSAALVPKFIRNVRFRKFVEPGDCCFIKVKVKEGNPRLDQELIVVSVTMMSQSHRVMQAEMGFMTMYTRS